MSKVKITGNASGSGVFTIAAPNSNTDRVLTLPDEAGTVLTSASDLTGVTGVPVSGPVFRATRTSAQSIPHNTATKVQFNSEVIDTDGCYDPTTNYRFTPTTAGYYQLSFSFNFQGHTIRWGGSAGLYKNGSPVLRATNGQTNGWDDTNFAASLIVEANGTTDYFEMYFYQYDYSSASSRDLIGTADTSYFTFQGHFLRGL